MTVDFLARESHFFDHLLPIWRNLDDEIRGQFYVSPRIMGHVAQSGVAARASSLPTGRALTVAASFRDMKAARNAGRDVVLSEHGAGQSYLGQASGSYIGAADRVGVVGVLLPSERAAENHRRAHPKIPTYVVGVPKLDRRHLSPSQPIPGRVVIGFHWECRICPETRSAMPFYRFAMRQLRSHYGVDLIGHAHPRAHIEPVFARAKIPYYDSFERVMDEAAVYVCDNSSTMYEFASLGRPVVVLNAPWYRRHIEHGLRFWEASDVGVQVDERKALFPAIQRALADDDPVQREARERAVALAYVACDGRATERAIAAIVEMHDRAETTDARSRTGIPARG